MADSKMRSLLKMLVFFRFAGFEEHGPLAGHLPANLAAHEGCQRCPANAGPTRPQPVGTDQQRPFGQTLVLVEVLERVAGEQVFCCR